MALDFTRLSDVTLVGEATETANVLIEEGGEIKRVPKTEVGGGGEWDAVFTVDNVYEIAEDTVHLTSGSFDAMKAKLDANDLPKVLVIVYWDYGDYMKACVEASSCQYNITQNAFNIYFNSNWSDYEFYHFSIASDGTISSERY